MVGALCVCALLVEPLKYEVPDQIGCGQRSTASIQRFEDLLGVF